MVKMSRMASCSLSWTFSVPRDRKTTMGASARLLVDGHYHGRTDSRRCPMGGSFRHPCREQGLELSHLPLDRNSRPKVTSAVRAGLPYRALTYTARCLSRTRTQHSHVPRHSEYPPL